MGNQFLNVNERIRQLMNDREILTASDLAEKMYSKGLLPKTKAHTNDIETKRNAERSIYNHINLNTEISINWLDKYCRFFGCSFDYLFYGANASIMATRMLSEHTGLSLKAAEKLNMFSNSFIKNKDDIIPEEQRHILSRIIESDVLIKRIYDYCNLSANSIQIAANVDGHLELLNDSSRIDFITIDGQKISLIETAKENKLKKIKEELDHLLETE